MAKPSKIRNLVVVSDLHCGCRLGLYNAEDPVSCDDGGILEPSNLQVKLWDMWSEFWGTWVPRLTKKEPYSVLVNGDAVDGVHHGSTTQMSQNLADQEEIAFRVLEPLLKRCEGRLYIIRGTEAHSGKSGVDEERLARRLKARPAAGKYARSDLWIRVGKGLVHCLHHIGTAGSLAYETTGPQKEIEQVYVESARWNNEIADMTVRSHRHRFVETRFLTYKGLATSTTTAGWQLKTPFAYRVAGARNTEPQIGGTIIRCDDREIYTLPQIWPIDRPAVEVP